MPFIRLRNFLLFLDFYYERCRIPSIAFNTSIEMVMLLTVSYSIDTVYYVNWFSDVELCVPDINPTWSCYIILSLHCWIQFAKILLWDFISTLIGGIGLQFSCHLFVWFCYQGNAALIKWIGNVYSHVIFWKSLWRIGVNSLNIW